MQNGDFYCLLTARLKANSLQASTNHIGVNEMKHTLNCTSGALLDTLIMVFEKKGFLRIGTKVFKVVGYRPGPGALKWDCEFDLEDHREGQQADAMVILPADTSHITVKPIPWNGPEDGLPPVGMTVRIPKTVPHHDYVKRFAGREVLIVAHAADSQANAGRVAVFQCKMDDGFNEYHGLTADRGNFEPIRTAEQLAAEERERETVELYRTINPVDGCLTKWEHLGEKRREEYRKAYDAGYRLVKP